MFNYRLITCYTSTNQRLDVFNSIFGKESIYLDGVLCSQKNSILGSQHQFQSEDSSFVVKIGYTSLLRIGFDIFENGKVIAQS